MFFYEYSWEGQFFGNDNMLIDLFVGDYVVVICDVNGCIIEFIILVRELEFMFDLVQFGIVNLFCMGFFDGVIIINIVNGQLFYQYNFNDGNGFVIINFVSGLSVGAYIVNVFDVNLCEGIFNIVFEDLFLLVVGLDVQGISCFGEVDVLIIVILEGGIGGYNIQWSIGLVEVIIRGLGEGIYSYIVMDVNGCVVLVDMMIIQFLLFEFLILDIQDVFCFGDMIGIVVLEGMGGVLFYEFSLDGQVFQVVLVFDSFVVGNYIFIVMDVNGCLASIQGSVFQFLEFIVDVGEDIWIELGYSG